MTGYLVCRPNVELITGIEDLYYDFISSNFKIFDLEVGRQVTFVRKKAELIQESNPGTKLIILQFEKVD